VRIFIFFYFSDRPFGAFQTDREFPLLNHFNNGGFYRNRNPPEPGFTTYSGSPAREYFVERNPTANSAGSQSQPRNSPPKTQQPQAPAPAAPPQQEDEKTRKESSPIPVIHNTDRSADSPKRFTTQTTIYPNQTTQPNPQPTPQPQPQPQPQPANNYNQYYSNNKNSNPINSGPQPIKVDFVPPTSAYTGPTSNLKSDFKCKSLFFCKNNLIELFYSHIRNCTYYV
jgi:hypothetical protein